jgi:hypothetical protein
MATKRVLTEEQKKELLGYVPFSCSASDLYTPDEFKAVKEDLRPIFDLRPLNQAEMTQIKKNSLGYTRDSTPDQVNAIADNNKEIIRECIKSWTNLYDAGSGEEIDFKKDKELFNRLPNWLINSITDRIRRISGLSSAEDLGLK